MCRWIAYSGSPITLDELILKPARSLARQSLRAEQGAETTNGDGFGVGWYDQRPEPGLFRSTTPAWSDPNLRELAAHVRSGLFFAHVRASTGSPVQQTNCHPFRFGRWLWMHNGAIREFGRVKRELVLAVDPALFSHIEGSTDSELMFYLALTFGLESDPPDAVARMAALIEETGRRHAVAHPIQMTVATTDGARTWVFRYSSEGQSRSLYYSTDMRALRAMYPDNPRLAAVSDNTRLIVSEPLSDLAGAWNEVPESSYGIVDGEHSELREFRPRG